MPKMQNVLIVIDYQTAFKTPGSSPSMQAINKLAEKHKWDKIVQTLWFNSHEDSSPYIKNLEYRECDPYDRASGLVKRFKDSIMVSRYDKYSCVDENLARMLHGDVTAYVAGWETDACVLGTCFDLFDRALTFKVVTDCVASKSIDAHNGALAVMRRNFGEKALTTSSEIKF